MHRAGPALGWLPQDLLAGWLQVLGHEGRCFWLTQSLAASSQGREREGGTGFFLLPALPVQQGMGRCCRTPHCPPSQQGGIRSASVKIPGAHVSDTKS